MAKNKNPTIGKKRKEENAVTGGVMAVFGPEIKAKMDESEIKGREEGREEEKVVRIKKIIRKGADTEWLADAFEVSPEYIEELRNEVAKEEMQARRDQQNGSK